MKFHIFKNDLGKETIVADGTQIPVVQENDPTLWADILSWLEGDSLVIGCKDNPAHVRRWEEWKKQIK